MNLYLKSATGLVFDLTRGAVVYGGLLVAPLRAARTRVAAGWVTWCLAVGAATDAAMDMFEGGDDA